MSFSVIWKSHTGLLVEVKPRQFFLHHTQCIHCTKSKNFASLCRYNFCLILNWFVLCGTKGALRQILIWCIQWKLWWIHCILILTMDTSYNTMDTSQTLIGYNGYIVWYDVSMVSDTMDISYTTMDTLFMVWSLRTMDTSV